MKKKWIALLVGIVMALTVFPAAVFGAGSGVTVSADRKTARKGDTISYTVTLERISDLSCAEFRLVIPKGMKYVSGRAADGLAATMGMVSADWTEDLLLFSCFGNMEGYSSSGETELLTFECVVTDGNAGRLKIGVEDLYFAYPDSVTEIGMTFSSDTVKVGSASAGKEPAEEPEEEKETVSTGALADGWRKDAYGNWYYMKNGSFVTGWYRDGGSWYYLGEGGVMQKGWLQKDGSWYYLSGSGAMKTGWLQSGGSWYYLSGSGAMRTGWLQSGGSWYYLSGSGAMKTGWLQDTDGSWYYLDGSGRMLHDTVTPDGFRLGADGRWLK
ncbi:MAG: hypothetical protein IKM31_08180 [Oscillospiraceae bacterium]|nr:hypothetical protein [Oscillospiraceae bacterium]